MNFIYLNCGINEELNVEKTMTFKYVTYALAKLRKPDFVIRACSAHGELKLIFASTKSQKWSSFCYMRLFRH